jgi:hypothetical protein
MRHHERLTEHLGACVRALLDGPAILPLGGHAAWKNGRGVPAGGNTAEGGCMTVRLEFECPHCGKVASVALGVTAKATIISSASTGHKPSAKTLCGCGHDRSHHVDGKGPCHYGHGTSTGGCRDCAGFHSRRRGASVCQRETKPSNLLNGAGAGYLGPCAMAVLRVLVQRAPKETTRQQVAILAEYSVDSGGFASALGQLRAQGLIEGPGDAMRVTDAGKKVAGPIEALPSGAKLLEHWSDRVGPCAATILQTLVTAHPREVGREELARATGYSATSGGFASAMAKLRTLSLVDGYRASDELMAAIGDPR